MNKEQVDEMAKAVIDRISVVPINKNTMKLEIKLLTGESEPMTYIRNGERYARRSGLTSKIISPEQQWVFTRNSVRNTGHCIKITYAVRLSV